MSSVEISESDHFKTSQYNDDNEIGEIYEEKGYSKIPLDQFNLNTEPISINTDFTYSFFDTNLKSYIKVFLGFIVFIIVLFMISILSGHFHYEKIDMNENEKINTENKINLKQEIDVNETPLKTPLNQTLDANKNKNYNEIDKNKKILK